MKKPAHGTKCNNCGQCCRAMRCPLGQMVFGPVRDEEACPALDFKFPGFTCGLVATPVKYAPAVVAKHGVEAARNAAALLIGAGMGCDALLVGETPNEEWRAWAAKQRDPDAAGRAAAIWNIGRDTRHAAK